MKVVIVGNGMAGARLAAELSTTEHEVTVLGAEEHPAYNRILLSSVLAGKHRATDIELVGAPAAKTRTGVTVTAIDRQAGVVVTADGEQFPYDHLILATGSRAIVPPIPGIESALTFRTLDDCRRILAAAEGARSALVLGGGLLGLEAARGLAGRGLKVDIVHAVGHLMERQLDAGASQVLARTLAGLGITAHLNATATAALRVDHELTDRFDGVSPPCDPDQQRAALELSDGRVLTADLLVVACGVRPDTGLARDAGLAVDRGVVVDERLRTSDRRVSAIGDCSQLGVEVGGLVAPAWEQARVVARQLGGDPLAIYVPPAPVTRLKASGIDLAAMGRLEAGADEDLSFADPVRGTYARLLIHGDLLTGAVLLGDNPSVGQIIQLFDRGMPVPPDRRSLLLGRTMGTPAASTSDTPALMPDAAAVCQCNSVTKGALVRCWRSGARGLDEIVAGTRATTGCGSCRDTVEGIVRWLAAADSELTRVAGWRHTVEPVRKFMINPEGAA